MALAEEKVIDKIEVVGDYNHVQVRTATRIYEDDILVGQTFHRHVISPLDDASNEDAEIQALCAELHTTEVKSAYTALLAEQEALT